MVRVVRVWSGLFGVCGAGWGALYLVGAVLRGQGCSGLFGVFGVGRRGEAGGSGHGRSVVLLWESDGITAWGGMRRGVGDGSGAWRGGMRCERGLARRFGASRCEGGWVWGPRSSLGQAPDQVGGRLPIKSRATEGGRWECGRGLEVARGDSRSEAGMTGKGRV